MEIRVLGPLEVRDGDESLPLGGAKQRSLLALLALSANRVVSRERLVDALWGDDPPETAVTTVQVYVSRLRKLLPAGTVVTRGRGYMLDVEPETIDLARFERLVAEARNADAECAARLLRDALTLCRGTPLADFDEPFAQVERARLEDSRLVALEQRIEADLTLGLYAELVGELEVLIAEHPHRERFRGQLMLALYRSGRQAEALGAYRDVRAALDELGIEPSEELRLLERSILTQDSTLTLPPQLIPDAPGLPGPLAAQPSSPFVGRKRELTTLLSLLQRTEAGEGQVALVAGEAGSGKTRLARELAHEAARGGAVVIYGSCDPIVDAPYQPFVEALRFLVRAADPEALESCMTGSRTELARLVPALGPPPAEITADPAAARQRLHAAVASLLANACHARPLLFVVDDIHWADGPTVHLLRDVARSAPEARLFLIATHRDRSEDTTAEFSDALAGLARMDGIVRLTLHGLSESDVADYIRASTGAEAAGDVSQAIHTLTDGTPFLLGELWRALVDADAVDAASGMLRLTRPLAELGSPQAVREVSRYRISRLTPPTTELLELAAVAGPQFELRLLEEAARRETLTSSLEEAVASGTIEELPGQRLAYRFSHELVRRALYDRLSALRKAESHLRVAEALERVHAGSTDAVLLELAHHFTVAAPLGGDERAAEYNVRAAEISAAVYAFDQVEEFATAALEFAAEETAFWARAQYLRATAEVNLARDGADEHAASAAAAFAALGDVEAAAEAEVLCARSLRNQRRPEADAAAARAFALVQGRPPSAAKAAALLAWAGALQLSHGRYREALEYSREAQAVAEKLQNVTLQVHALLRAGIALSELGEGGIPELERAIELGRDGGAPDAVHSAYNNLAAQMGAQGRQRESARLFAEARVEVERFGLLDALERVTGMQASFAFHLGEWTRAEEFIAEWVDLVARSPGSRWQNSLISNIRANIARARGDHAGALAHAQTCLAESRRANNFQATGRALAVLGLTLLEQDRRNEADPLVEELLTLVDDRSRALYWRWTIDLAYLLYDLRRPESPPITPYPAWNEPAQAIGRGDLTGAAELLAVTDMVTDEAYARLRAGEQLAGLGRHAEARPCLERAAAFYRSVGGTAYLERALAASRTKVETRGPVRR